MIRKPQLVGILNITPDSFSDGGDFLEQKKAIIHAKKLWSDGADIIDIGGESTRPGAQQITPEQEWNRVKAVLKNLLNNFDPQKISLDTKHWRTAHKFLSLGGQIINDVSGGIDPRMHETVAKFDATMIINHFPGQTVAEVHEQKISSMSQVRDELLITKQRLLRAGINPHKIILDPGIGFGKTTELNWELLRFGSFIPDEKIYIGYSRKRFLGECRYEINRNLEAAQIAFNNGVDYLRVHDVQAHKTFLEQL